MQFHSRTGYIRVIRAIRVLFPNPYRLKNICDFCGICVTQITISLCAIYPLDLCDPHGAY